MKRDDLKALLARVDYRTATIGGNFGLNLSDLAALVDFARQIAQAQPVAWKAYKYLYGSFEEIPGELLPPHWDAPQPLYTLPLED